MSGQETFNELRASARLAFTGLVIFLAAWGFALSAKRHPLGYEIHFFGLHMQELLFSQTLAVSGQMLFCLWLFKRAGSRWVAYGLLLLILLQLGFIANLYHKFYFPGP